MNHQKISTKKLVFLISAMSTTVLANANQFEPSSTPIFSTPQAKPNIHMVLDDSASMKSKDIMMPEHGYSFGQPVCDNPGSEWSKERQRLGEYDPFSTGRYVPWDDTKANNGMIDDKKQPPRLMNCTLVTRTDALKFAVNSVLSKYREKAYMGVSFLWQVNDNDRTDTNSETLIRLPIGDYSELSASEFADKVINPVNQRIDSSPGRTPMYPAVYEAIKMLRGQPVTNGGVYRWSLSYPGFVKETCEDGHCFYPYTQFETPLRYRCQQTHMLVMTDGEPNENKVWGIGEKDNLVSSQAESSNVYVNGVNQSVFVEELTGKDIGRLTANVDLRSALKPVYKNGTWSYKNKDDAGKDWKDELSIPMPITTHSVSLYVDPKSRVYLDMTEPTEGMNLGFGQGEGDAEDLVLAFDTIFSSIIRSTSSTLSTNDRNSSDVLEEIPVTSGGVVVDLSLIGTIRYDTTYNFSQRVGNIRAMAPYISDYVTSSETGKLEPVITTVELWNTNNTIKPHQGRYLTFLDSSNNGQQFTYLDDKDVKKRFNSIYDASSYGEKFDDSYIDWLTNSGQYSRSNNLRSRLQPMGSITNSDLVLANKDVLHINAAKDRMSANLGEELIDYLKYKAKFQPVNYLIVADNDGFINFVNAQRGLTGYEVAGARNTAYFPQLLAYRLDEIAKDNRDATLVIEGKTKLVDAKVYQPSVGDIYATIGLTSMGSGGKGLVGYRVYAATEKSVNEQREPKIDDSNPINKVIPLFEITNEGPEKFRTKGFEDLGYTYSGFEVFNHIVDQKGQAVAVFGNGFGVDQSILYFIDAYTGDKLHEIILSKNGGGASTPSIIVQKSHANNGQVLDRIYVGDYSGTLYRVDFKGQDFTDKDAVKVTSLFQASTSPSNAGQSAISIKPLVTKNKSSGLYSIAFGTGIAASKDLDRGDNSLVEHSVYNIIDRNKVSDASTATVAELAKQSATLWPLLSLNNLKVGTVDYEDGSSINYNVEDKHEVIIETPKASNPSSGQDGWSVRLIADGTRSGERTLQNPKYDSTADAIVFATWGIYERNLGYIVEGLFDPCLADAAFGKILSFNSKTGGSSGKKGIYNQGSTGTAEGGLTGNGIVEDLEGNSSTDLSQIEGLEDELEEITGSEDSSHVSDEENMSLHCVGDIFGKPECVEIEPIEAPEPLPQGRINFKKINAYY